ncbi:hypothetical protein ACWGHD_04465 [Streptomyces xanthophaeus]
MNPAVIAARRAGQLLTFVGVLSVLGVDWSVWDRIAIGIALLAAVVVTVHLGSDGQRTWPRQRTRYDTTA